MMKNGHGRRRGDVRPQQIVLSTAAMMIAGGVLGSITGLIGTAIVPAVAQVAEPSESDFFDNAKGTWCRLDLHDPATMELVIPDNADGMLTSVLQSPMMTIETEARFVDFVVEDNRVVVTFQGATSNTRGNDGSVYVIDFAADFIFDMALTRFNLPGVIGRQAHFSRCDVGGFSSASKDPATDDSLEDNVSPVDETEAEPEGASAAPLSESEADPDQDDPDPDNPDPGDVGDGNVSEAEDLPVDKKASAANGAAGRFQPIPDDVSLPPLPALEGFEPPTHRI